MTGQDIEPARLSESEFAPARTLPILEAACRRVGIDGSDATLLRHHTNAVYVLAREQVVVKIGRPEHRHIDVVGLVRWLEGHRVPSVALIDVEQPIEVAGCPVTFWRYLDQRGGLVSAVDLAGPLAALHALPPRPPVDVPDQQISRSFDAITKAIDSSRILSPTDRALLHEHREQLAVEAFAVRYVLDTAVIHGDAHHRNALWDRDGGRAVLCDWESAAVGPPEWDLVTLEVHCRRFGHPPREYDEFCREYGFDVRDWDGYAWLRRLRELRMITTNARKAAVGSSTVVEVRRRIEALRAGEQIGWSIL
ncbi:aminoglycoside phosphotransferase family protein [Nocardia otitidiscaviarum]|uniref:aminoglycoside phosphotransferase family protein n=1 Tax=Nocardia otitidiscaviarum TaxID=1823 RepID=UPI0024568EFA|nr:aminoglycoside phosphotransferase family protein [Nocardia otitidiscaviarum]